MSDGAPKMSYADDSTPNPILSALARLEAGQADTTNRLSRLEGGFAQLKDTVARVEGGLARVESEQTRLREQLNNKMDDLLDKMATIRMDTDTARGNVLYALQDSLTQGQRITRLEEEMRKGRPPL